MYWSLWHFALAAECKNPSGMWELETISTQIRHNDNQHFWLDSTYHSTGTLLTRYLLLSQHLNSDCPWFDDSSPFIFCLFWLNMCCSDHQEAVPTGFVLKSHWTWLRTFWHEGEDVSDMQEAWELFHLICNLTKDFLIGHLWQNHKASETTPIRNFEPYLERSWLFRWWYFYISNIFRIIYILWNDRWIII